MICDWCRVEPAVRVVVCGNETKYACAEDVGKLEGVVRSRHVKKYRLDVWTLGEWEKVRA